MNNEVELKIEKILKLCEAGNDRHEVAKMLGYKDYKGLQAYMQRHQYTWNEEMRTYQLLEEYQKQMKTERVLRKFEDGVSSKPARIISMFSKKLEARDIAKKLGYESHKTMASYMKSRGYAWNAEIRNYERDSSISIGENEDIDTEFEGTSDARHLDILELLDSKKEKLLELLNSYSNDDMAMPRYVIGGLCVTKSVHMVTGLDLLIREYSTEKNISQKDMFQIAIIEFLKKYGYKREVETLVGL
ncbi:hypothetical protein NBE98_15225 [Clostridium swellfunianum]|uniref:hypothetical protein n=1 Tax=Clostridium swellfunianum TaxID=1367462 RepID=UPI0020302CA5|nr:hypothetical protein [Clostridium swellfunianum]MCM0649717.1 hypothetical protein [Clostridium swellfunianum]